MYRPKFCVECGEKILRLRWHSWTSRRFCDECVPRFRREQLTNASVAIVVILLLGIAAGRAMRPPAPPLVIQRREETRPQSNAAATAPVSQTEALIEDVYICGARTKKGTPCSRRVHGPVRCWQHKGMPAMLPAEKLRVKDLAP